jgi:hypothetical protein
VTASVVRSTTLRRNDISDPHRLKFPTAPVFSSGQFNRSSHRPLQRRPGEALWHELQLFYSPSFANTPEDSVVSRTGFVQPFDRVCIELKARGANDFVELCK